MDGTALFTQIGDCLITTDHKILNLEKESRGGHKKRSSRARKCHELDPELSDEDKGNIGTNFVSMKIYSSVTEVGNNSHRQFRSIYESL